MKVKYTGSNPIRLGDRAISAGEELDLPEGTAESLCNTPDWEKCSDAPKKTAKKVAKKVSKKATDAEQEQPHESES